MTPDEQRVEIARACGYTAHEKEQGDGAIVMYFLNPSGKHCHDIPDYLNDLNAMHEAEKWMHEDSYRGYEYDMTLCNVVKAYEGVGNPCNHLRLYHATAAQRAEAFLRTIGKWKDTPK